MDLAEGEIRDILARATEIERTLLPSQADLETVIQAAEEAGIPRFAVERALRERQALIGKPPSAGDFVFARSTDDKFYVAEVLATPEDGFRVRFLRGGEHTVSLDELRPCTFLPGQRVVCDWPYWGPWTCTVVSYDAVARKVTVTDGWGSTAGFSIADVWIAPRKSKASRKAGIYAALAGAAAAGAAIGSLITALLF